jgi:hypothetical protein
LLPRCHLQSVEQKLLQARVEKQPQRGARHLLALRREDPPRADHAQNSFHDHAHGSTVIEPARDCSGGHITKP